jgi:tRNA dimethylallyltransferase
MSNYSSILISGPTASGKSKLALDIAEKVGGVVINADSMQIYNTISLITARPSNQDMDTIPHFLYGYIDPKIRYSVGEWISDIEPLINFLIKINKIPVIVGGTGLYFAGLFGEISEIPEISAKTRLKWEEIKEHKGTQELFDKLKELDPKSAATINSTDTTRIIRALEVFDDTGKSIRDWQLSPGKPIINKSLSKMIYLCPPRNVIDDNIIKRTSEIIGNDQLYEEIKLLSSKKISDSYPIMKAIGVKDTIAYLEDEISIEILNDRIITDTKRYVKRQLTWARKKMMDWEWIDEPQYFF